MYKNFLDWTMLHLLDLLKYLIYHSYQKYFEKSFQGN